MKSVALGLTLLLAQAPGVVRKGAEARPPDALRAEAQAEVVEVVDGDTLDVRIEGESVTLRLRSVDNVDKISGRPNAPATKAQTIFGQETALWARELIEGFRRVGEGPVRVGLAFPEGRRADPFGRLLAHVILPDGRDLNVLLVEQGKSPYFNKYGNSVVAHEAFVRAQAAARAAGIGIWDPATNRARTPGAPSALRPYERLLPWWEARAAAVEAFRARASRNGSPPSPSPSPLLLSAEDPSALQLAFERCKNTPELRVTVFATIERFYDEADGSLTALLRSGDARSALRAAVSAAERVELEPWLRASTEEFRQNYLYVSGRMQRNARGFVLTGTTRADWSLAEPAFPPPERR